MYKNETLLDIYSKIIDHFSCSEIKELFFYAPSGQRIRIPLSKIKVSQFVRENVICNPVKLEPIYPLPNPVIYRLFLDDGHCINSECSNQHCAIFNNNNQYQS
jgi:hypothetical protein